MNFIDVLDTAAAGGSDYALSKKLNISRQMVCHFRNGRKIPSDEVLDKMAEIANLDPIKVYLAAYAEKLGNPEIAEQFRGLATH